MILKAIFELIYFLLSAVFGWINLPQVPAEISNGITGFFDLIFDNLTLLGFFIRPITITVAIPILIILINFDKVYKLTMFIVKKLPFSIE